MLKIKKIPWHLLAIVTLILLLRGPTLGLSVIDWDETAYALVAREILSGFWPYAAAFDHKPAALYYHFAIVMSVFGDNPTSSRLVGLFMVLGSSLLLRSILLTRLHLSPVSATIFTLFFIVAVSGLNGATSNTEHVVNFYVLAWVWATYKAFEDRPLYFVLVGILMGISFHSNYLTGFIMVGYSAGFIALISIREQSMKNAILISIKAGALAILGFLGASIFILAPIALWGDLNQYFTLQRDFISGYNADEGSFWAARGTMKLFVPLFFIMMFFAYKIFFNHQFSNENKKSFTEAANEISIGNGIFLMFLLLGSMAATAGSGRFYAHYFLFSFPALLLVLAWLYCSAKLSKDASCVAILFLIGSFLSIGAQGPYYAVIGAKELVRSFSGKEPQHDEPRLIANKAQQFVSEGETIYVVCAQPVLYQLLDAKTPTRYSYYIHHFSEDYTSALGFTVAGEVTRILDQNPSIIIMGNYEKCFPTVKVGDWEFLAKEMDNRGYRSVASVNDYHIYQLNDGSY